MKASDALIVEDVQNDFCPGGALAVAGGDAIVPVINLLVPRFTHVVFTRDWHPANHCSFDPQPRFVDGSWPVHCVADTPGAALRSDLVVPADAWLVNKATEPDREAYSGFGETPLADDLRHAGVTRVFVCGLATDYCVKWTTLDALRAGFETYVVEDACRGVDIPAGSAAAALAEMVAAGAKRCQSREVV